MTDFYQIASGWGKALQDGQDQVMQDRIRQAQLEGVQLDNQRLRGLADDQQYARTRQRGMDAELDASAAGAGASAGGSAGVPAPSAAGAPGASGGFSSPAALAAQYELMSKHAFRRGDAKGMTESAQAAQAARRQAAFNTGATSYKHEDAEVKANGTPGNLQANPGTPNLAIGSMAVKGADGKASQYTVTTIDPSGRGYSFLATDNDLRAIAGYSAAMQVDPQWALDGLRSIDAHLATLYATKLKQQLDVQNANSTAIHNQATDANGRTTAGAAATTAKAHASYYGAQVGEIKANRENLNKAQQLQAQFDALSPEDQNGPQGLALRRQFNMLNAKPGTQLQAADPRQAGGGAAALRYQADNEWADAEKKLVGDNVDPKDIAKQKSEFYARRGFAPEAAVKQMLSGRALDGSRLAEADLHTFNRLFPHTPLDPSQVPWLKKAAAPAAASSAPRRGLPVKTGNWPAYRPD